jgi:ATP-binding cassette subfamily G (WHITE) protein 2 (PDR)
MAATLTFPGHSTSTDNEKENPADLSSSSFANSNAEEDLNVHETQNQEVLSLARKLTAHSTHDHNQSPFTAEKDSCLDPTSPNFRWRDWAKAFYNVRYTSGNELPRTAGVAFKNLNVWGRGSPTDFQMSVGNAVLKLPSLFGRGSQKIDILRNMDGLLLAGEQLCVLGPPG